MDSLDIQLVPYPSDLLSRYRTLSQLEGFSLLQSSDDSRGRYDIVAALPYDQILIERGAQDIVDKIKAFKNKLSIKASSCSLPFQGGAIGYISYDLGAELAGIKAKPYCTVASTPLMEMRFYDWAFIVDHLDRKVYLVSANRCKQTKSQQKGLVDLWNNPKAKPANFLLKHSFECLKTQQDYQNAFYAIYEDLKKGRAYQVNFSIPFISSYEGEPWGMYERVVKKNKVPFGAYIKSLSGDILSFSPERFILGLNQILLTSPIKGSSPRASEPQLDKILQNQLLKCAKNRAENVMIVDLMRNDLGKIAKTGTVNVQALCELQSFQQVHHLVSHIQAECRENIDPIDAFFSCFPGGSITGAPKLEAMKMISEQEGYARGVYCGSVAYFSSHGQFDSNIAIRTAVANDNSIYLPAGGGIVIDSLCEEEFSECYTKIKAILSNI